MPGLDATYSLNLLTMRVSEKTEMGCLNTWVNTSRRSLERYEKELENKEAGEE